MGNSPNGDLMVGTCAKSCGYANADAVLDYSYAMYPDSPTPITDGVASVYSLAFDDTGNMLVGNCATCGMVKAYSITKYAPGGTSPIATITGGSTCGTAPFVCEPISLAADSAQNIFVGNGPGGATNENIAEFQAPAYGGNGTLFFNGLGYQPDGDAHRRHRRHHRVGQRHRSTIGTAVFVPDRRPVTPHEYCGNVSDVRAVTLSCVEEPYSGFSIRMTSMNVSPTGIEIRSIAR